MDKKLLSILVCPLCKGHLELQKKELWCYFDKLAYPIQDDIPVMIVEKARSLSMDEWEKK
jgi:uncharacterized protein YbaR (Trm112 family)